ncbi:putative stage III sporulation protein AB [Clostridium celatum DSM 1785]|uniref:Putative stage III sporulation protein AB n=2 Tax=Clostridium celatum TaxID=36834 RepID=L1QH30_9CLOT|nr:putative stage III sporulation protein AB [Clostridium celatum DSM 1785]
MSINLNDVDIKGVYEAFTIAYKKYKDEINLSKDDYKILSDFFKTIGECDAVTQEKVFTVALENLNLNYIDANNEANVNVKMYRTLGISIGIMIAIFFI